ncbi:alginate O-acetyltransferase AlgX-related protein [Pontibacter vulgaris]|uniref:alginate O-acetyltransferase AlgX-related protein n=1 Tax=Pontibacter vulgaris TaxID=2905679 RepID=UPI001FA7812E|nr:hypothetical protein [Pontibacter vulgaris]
MHKAKKHEVKKMFGKLGLLLLPFVLCIVVEIFILPIDYFTFRPWETLSVQNVKVMTGPFYPGMDVQKVAAGEIAPHSQYAVPQLEHWITDKYGFRNRDANTPPEVVLIGDSYIAGAALTQDELLSESLERRLHKKVYSFAPADPVFLDKFLASKRFKETPPEVVIFSRTERRILDLPPVNEHNIEEIFKAEVGPIINESPLLTKAVVTMDRITKWSMYHYVRASLDRAFEQKEYNVYNGELFLHGEQANKPVSEEEIKRTASIIEGYAKAVEKRGMKFVFLPVPNKENIYYQLLPSQTKPNFLPQLIAELQRRKVNVVDLQEPFYQAYIKYKIPLYPKDDNHWNENGVNITAEILTSYLNDLKVKTKTDDGETLLMSSNNKDLESSN